MISLVVAGAIMALAAGLFAAQSRQVHGPGSADTGAHESGMDAASATEPLVDIASRAAGGCVFYSEPKRAAGGLAYLVDRNPETYARIYQKKGAVSSFVLAFKANEEALVRSVGLRSREKAGQAILDHLPVQLRVFASDNDPFSGYKLAGEFKIARVGGEQVFELSVPVRARFLKVTFALPPDQNYVEIGEFTVHEGSAEGYESIVRRQKAAVARTATGPVALKSLIPGARVVQEVESNDRAAIAHAADLDVWIRGRLASEADVDLFRYTLADLQDDEIPVLELHMLPFLRGRVRVLDGVGQSVQDVDVAESGGSSLKTTLLLAPGEYLLELAPEPTYVLLSFDASGSMAGTFTTTIKAVQQWADAFPAGFFVALATSKERSEAAFTVYCPFTQEPDKIKRAVAGMLNDGGISDWYSVLRDLLKYPAKAVPKRADRAVVYMADGNGSGDFYGMWESLRRLRARLYTIGFGHVGAHLDYRTSWDGACGLFNVAWYRSGRYYEPHTEQDLVKVYEAIFKDLMAKSEYALCLKTRKRLPGMLVTGVPKGENRPIHIILDASGSMMEEIRGRTRLQIAKDVISQVIGELPAKSRVGLRVYGHRFSVLEREKAATDSELLFPIGRLKRTDFLRALGGVRARGGTPLAYSLEQAAKDLKRIRRPRVILITDGVEGFRGKPVRAATALSKVVPGMDLAVIGFAIGAMVDQENLRNMAQAAGGTYYNASGADALIERIRLALHPSITYAVLDERGREVTKGRFGNRHTLKEGAYTVVVPTHEKDLRLTARIEPNAETFLPAPELPKPLRAGQFTRPPAPASSSKPPAVQPRQTQPRKPKPKVAAKFCTQCGARLKPGANFCTQCGAEVAR